MGPTARGARPALHPEDGGGRGEAAQGDRGPDSGTCLFLSKTRPKEGRKRTFWISHVSGFPQERGDHSPPCKDSGWMVRMQGDSC